MLTVSLTPKVSLFQIEVPSHHPDSVTIRAGYPKRRGDRKPALEMGEDGWEGDCEPSNGWPQPSRHAVA